MLECFCILGVILHYTSTIIAVYTWSVWNQNLEHGERRVIQWIYIVCDLAMKRKVVQLSWPFPVFYIWTPDINKTVMKEHSKGLPAVMKIAADHLQKVMLHLRTTPFSEAIMLVCVCGLWLAASVLMVPLPVCCLVCTFILDISVSLFELVWYVMREVIEMMITIVWKNIAWFSVIVVFPLSTMVNFLNGAGSDVNNLYCVRRNKSAWN